MSFYDTMYKVFGPLVRALYRIDARGTENIPEGGIILASNHTAFSDVLIISAAANRQVRYMAKKELFKIPLLSGLIRMLGAFPIDRAGNDVGAIKTAVSMVKEGKCMGIFPQGHRYPGENPRQTRTKNGAALICTRAEADIVPVYIMKKNNKHKLFQKTQIIIGEKIPFESFQYQPDVNGEYARITNIIFDRICSIGEDFSKEKQQ